MMLFILMCLSLAQADPVIVPKEQLGALVKTDEPTIAKYCKNQNNHLIKSTPIKGQIGYFVKPLIMDGKLYYSAVIDNKPTIVDLKGQPLVRIEGNQDPLVSFDHKLLTVLKGNAGNFKLKFYDATNITEKNAKEIPSNIHIFGAYQSIAPLKSLTKDPSYRLVIDRVTTTNIIQNGQIIETTETAPAILDFKKTPDGIVKIDSDFRTPCSEKRLQTPFISKTGKLLAAFNLETQTTQIFDISDGKCSLKHDVDFATGKADFSYDDKKIAFHVAAIPMRDKQGWVQNLGIENSSNIFTYDLETKKINQITKNQNSNSYYPAFLPDGTLIHIDSEDKNEKSVFSIGHSNDTPTTDGSLGLKEKSCNEVNPEILPARLAIGQLLYGICTDQMALVGSNRELDSTYFVLKANEINAKECAALVENYWTSQVQNKLSTQRIRFTSEAQKTAVLSLKKQDLLIGCKYNQ